MSTVDLYQLQCAVATLVWAVGRGGRLDAGELRRVDDAVAVLSTTRDTRDSSRGVGEAIDRLLSKAGDPKGARTVAAIDGLAQLIHVETDAARTLSARLRPTPPGQQQLFDPDDRP